MIKKMLVTLPVLLLTACAPPKPAAELPTNELMPVAKREAKTATVSSFELSGAMAAKNSKKAWTASINWLQRGAGNYQIRLMGPLGGGTVIIDKKGSEVSFRDGPKTVHSSNADELLFKQTGIRLPVNNLYYWVRGLPAPGPVGSRQQDNYNHLTSLNQAGYHIDYTRYTSVKGIDLPSMIRLEGHGVMVKLIIKNWRIG